MGLAIRPTAQTVLQLVKLHFARSTCCYVQLELKTCILRTRLALQSCDFQAGAQNLYLRFKVAIFQPELETCTSRTTLALYKVVTFQLVLETCTLCTLDLYFKVAAGNLYLAC